MSFNQSEFKIRCEWGQNGIEMLAPISDVVIIVDVMSFTSAVSVAISHGAIVYPYKFKVNSAREYAKSLGAKLAGYKRSEEYSLSPLSLQKLQKGEKIVLPSPNGSTLSLSTGNTPTLAGCLRNAETVAKTAMNIGESIAVIPAGERWRPGNTLRPSFEDQIGAGAIISYLSGKPSPEAEAALTIFHHCKNNLRKYLRECSSGKELRERGFEADIDEICKLNVDKIAPILQHGAYQAT